MSDDDTLRLKVDGNPCEIELKALEKSVAAISKLCLLYTSPSPRD